MPRTWASGDNAFLPIGNLVGIGSSANTLVAIAKKASDSSWMTPTAVQPSAGNPTVSMQVSATNKLSYVSGATDKDTGITWQASDGWSLIAVDKAGGTATPNGHLYVYSTNTWTHSAAGSTVGGNSTDLTGGKVQHGRWATGDPFIGDMAIAGIWKRQLSQTEIEYLAFDLQQWYASAPDYLVIFDQSATSQNVIDLITGNTEQSHSGVVIGTSSVPVFGYGFREIVAVGHASGGQSAALAVASETDTAIAAGRAKARAVAVATETDSAIATTRGKARTVAIATETDTGGTLGRAKARTLAIAATTDSAITTTRVKARALTTAGETDAAQALGRAKVRSLAVAGETDTGGTLARVKARTLAAATETDSSQALTRSKVRVLAVASTTDTAGTMSRLKTRIIGIPSETDTGGTLAHGGATPAATATETDTAGTLGRSKVRVLALATDTSTALVVSPAHVRALAVAAETDAALALGTILKRRTLAVASETDGALSVTSPSVPRVLVPAATYVAGPQRATHVAGPQRAIAITGG
jgi:hypothetical protein